MSSYKLRRVAVAVFLLIIVAIPLASQPADVVQLPFVGSNNKASVSGELASLEVKGRASKTGYKRSEFGNGWDSSLGCDTRNTILARDLTNVSVNESCKVISGTLNDPYTGKVIQFTRGETTSDDVQIDHVVALSDAWQKGAQQLTYYQRVALANDPLNLLAVDGAANQQKSDGDAATWLPSNKAFRCQYVQRQVSVKQKYKLWVTEAERSVMARVISTCVKT